MPREQPLTSHNKESRAVIFCHLLNDHSGSPTVLNMTMEAVKEDYNRLLYVGSEGHGALETTSAAKRRFWYRRSRLKFLTLLAYIFSQFSLYRKLSSSKDIPNEAIVFVNTLLPIAAMFWGKRTGRPVIVHIHEVSIRPFPLHFIATRLAKHCSEVLIYVSRDHLNRLPISKEISQIIPNPINKSVATNSEKYTPRRRNGIFRVLMLSSLKGYKGIEQFMALAQTLQSRQDIAFELVLNAEKAEIDHFLSRHRSAINVTCHPRTSKPAQFYSEADLVLNLTLVNEVIETFGLTLIEAMCFGIPVIAPPVGGPAEIVTHGVEGYCIDSRDISALRAAVIELADDPNRATTMSKAAKKRAEDFTFDIYAKRINDIISQVHRMNENR